MKKIMMLVLLCGVAAMASAEIYKWKDADGRVHYSDTPPAGQKGKAQVINTKDLPVSSLPANRGEARTDGAAPTPGPTPAPGAEAKPAAAAAPKDAAACEAARKRNSFLNENKLYKAINEKGDVEFVDAEKRKRELAETEEAIKKNCQ
ncbi:DUF4124 domain-containing protein [Chitiniphilus shinanonensis]|uniref:DUF4124 domain-containing protein n=1 Tax=Chitiniphilus shinanonensis TaxID=553088 RepID=UPI0030222C14